MQPTPYPMISPFIRHTSLQFVDKDVVGDQVKGLAEVKIAESQNAKG